MDLLRYILGNKKLVSLFQGSLEMQKFIFATNILELLEDDDAFQQNYMNKQDKQKLNQIYKQYPYLNEYVQKIKAGQTGQEFLKLTQEIIMKQRRESVTAFVPRHVISDSNEQLPGVANSDDEDISEDIDHRVSQPRQSKAPADQEKRKSTILSVKPGKVKKQVAEKKETEESEGKMNINMGALINGGLNGAESSANETESEANKVEVVP